MSKYEMYFSPTGGTEKVMKILGEELKTDTVIDLSCPDELFEKYVFEEEDFCLIGVPSFGGRVPQTALERIRKMTVHNTPAVLVVVYGNRAYDDTLLELADETRMAGFRPVAAICASAEHSIMHQFGTGRPDEKDASDLKGYACAIRNMMEERGYPAELKVPGNVPYREYNGVPFKPSADENCSECGLCAEKCPVGAIPKENPSGIEEEKCISCMRCISVCPKGARGLNAMMLAAVSQKMQEVCSGRKENELFI